MFLYNNGQFLLSRSFLRPFLSVVVLSININSVISTHGDGINTLIKCKDDSGNPVDWFLSYKLPKIHDSPNPHIRQGLGYAFLFPGSGDDWKESIEKGIEDLKSLVGMTLQPLFHEGSTIPNDLAYILYNDQPPIGPTQDSGGHTKGVILANENGGIWLQHSVPHFPSLDNPGTYSYPKTGETNGQLFHCLSLGLDQIDNIGNVLEVTKPHVYNFSIPNELANKLPTLKKVVRGRGQTQIYQYQFREPHQNEAHEDDVGMFYEYETKQWNSSLRSDVNNKLVQIQNAGHLIYSFSKGPSFHSEIYADWIAPKWRSELDVQSWLNGPNPYPSNCTSADTKVYNIDSKSVSGSKFSTHNDHSKWAIATKQPVVCVGDLNRMEHQKKRGGAVNCFMDKAVWKAFKKTVLTTQPCPRP